MSAYLKNCPSVIIDRMGQLFGGLEKAPNNI